MSDAVAAQQTNNATSHTTLVNLLKDASITFTGRSIQGDITRLTKQFKNLENAVVQYKCLHKMAQCCRVIPRGGTFGLADYSKELLGGTIEKDLQTSGYSRSNLSSQQQLYAAKFGVYALRIDDRLQLLPDLSIPLDVSILR
jgi:ribonuclease D